MIKKRRKIKIESEDLDITSLLDILTILLVFLLRNFSESDLTVNLVDQISLPITSLRSIGAVAPIVQVNSKRYAWINDKMVGELDKVGPVDDKIVNALIEIKNSDKDMEKLVNINLVLDRDLEYSDIQTLMSSCAKAGFGQFKFIVQGDEE